MQNIVQPELRSSPDLYAPIWRYLTLAKFLSLLELRAMWFSRLDVLQDTFEGTIPLTTKTAMQKDHQKWETLFPQPELREQIRHMAEKNEESGRRMKVVNCWFLGESELKEMWEKYSGPAEGVILKSSIERLATSLALEPQFSRIGNVQYVDFDTHDMGIYKGHQAVERAFLKRLEYQHEKEIRIATMNLVAPGCLNPDGSPPSEKQLAGPGMFDPDRLGIYVCADLDSLIESMHVSPGSGRWFLNTVQRLVRRYGITGAVRSSSLE